MSALSLALGTRATARLSVDVGKPLGVRTWLLQGGYYVRTDSTGDEFHLTTNDARDFLSYVAYDFSRFALSSWESLAVCRYERDAVSLLGWPLIKLYYAAFFAAHSLMRADGGGVIRVERDQARHLTEYGKLIVGDDFSVSPGNFEIFTNQDAGGALEVRLIRLAEGGGAHDGFWKRFSAFLTSVEQREVAQSAPNANDIVAEITALQGLLRAKGGDNGTWLSVIRNRINYQHDFDVWFPTKTANVAYEALDTARNLETRNIRLDYNASRDAVRGFVSAAQYLASLSRDVCEQVAVQSTSAVGFGSKWRRLKASVSPAAVAQIAA